MDKMKELFIRDSRNNIRQIIDSLIRYETADNKKELIENAFRAVHSIKTESSYLHLSEISRLSHKLENDFEDLRSGRIKLDSSACSTLISKTEKLQAAIKSDTDSVDFEIKEIPLESQNSSDDKLHIETIFNQFEIDVLADSMKRGEKFYKVICRISPDSQMKYPRLYLIINNLELKTTLLKTIPSADEVENDTADIITAYLTTDKSIQTITDLVNVDEVINIQIVNLPYEFYLEGNNSSLSKISAVAPAELLSIPVNVEKLDNLFFSVQDMRIFLKSENDISRQDKLIKYFDKKLALIEKEIRELRMVTVSEEFKSIPSMIRKLAYNSGKDADVVFYDNNIEIDRSIFEYIYDPIIHIFRNAIDHGIETSETRLKMGKKAKGTIKCITMRNNNNLSIEIIDDGKGININKVAEKSGYNITELKNSKKLVEVLSSPGFTTKLTPTETSGRGFGLNLVNEKLSAINGAGLEITTSENTGTTVRLILPDSIISKKLLYIFRSNKIIALPFDYISETIEDSDEKYSLNFEGQKMFRDIPVFTENGYVFSESLDIQKAVSGALIEVKGRKGFFPAEKILFTQPVPADRFNLSETDTPYLFTFSSYYYFDCPGFLSGNKSS